MFTTRHILIALVAATAITGASMTYNQPAGTSVAKDQSRVGAEGGAQTADTAAQWTVTVLREGKAGRLMADGSCENHSWPYVPAPCLVIADGANSPNAVRTVTVEHGTLTGSILARVPVTQVAAQ